VLHPFLLVGVGGSGGKTLRIIRDDLLRRLRQKGWQSDDLPAAWQFIHVDVPIHADGDDIDLPPQLPDSQYLGMVKPGVDYAALDNWLLKKSGKNSRDSLGTWRPDPNDVFVSPAKGAGQYRALGRIITLTGLEDLQHKVAQARRELTGANVVAELNEVTRLLGGKPGTAVGDPVVIVISSIAGGTGAGALIDVCDVIRALPDKWADQSIGILYAPDVFDDLPEEMRRGVRANALGTLAEVLNGYWNNEGPSEPTVELFQGAQVTLNTGSRRSGPRFPFLVGAKNDRVSYKSQNDVYRAMGRSIASWMASERLQDALTAYTVANWSNTNQSVADYLPMSNSAAETPFSAIGSARVGLGRDRFLDYGSQRLARAVVERLTEEHEKQRTGYHDERTRKKLIKDCADAAWGRFLVLSKLAERGPDHNDIVDALEGDFKTVGQRLDGLVTNTVQQALSTAKDNRMTSRDLAPKIYGTVRDNEARVSAELQQDTFDRARVWVQQIQDHLLMTVAQAMGENGGPVTEALLHRLDGELQSVCEELKQEQGQWYRYAEQYAAKAQAAFSGAEKAWITTTADKGVQAAISDSRNSVLARYRAWLRGFAIETIEDLRGGFIQPLITAVSGAHDKLSVDKRLETSIVASWPFGDSVPSRLAAGPNEFLLESIDTYPEQLDNLVHRTVDPEGDPDAVRRAAEIQIALGNDDLSIPKQQLIKMRDRWVPKDHRLSEGLSSSPRSARFDVAVSPEQILSRAEDWMTREGTAIGRYLEQGLRDYLDPQRVPPTEHDRRLRQFEGQLVAALDTSAPLVKINPAVLVNVHGKDRPRYVSMFSEIPLPDNSPAKDRMRKILQSRGEWTPDVEKHFVDTPGGAIDIFTCQAEAYEPVVFDSLMRPIADDWGQKSKHPDSQAEFWNRRRARPLTEFIPVSRSGKSSVLRDMVTGWFVAGLLGQLQSSPEAVQIWIPETHVGHGHWAAFPSPMLTREPLNGPEALSVVLGGMMLAMLEVNTRENIEPMAPYARLRELGEAPGGFSTAINDELRDWVINGTNSCPTIATSTASPEQRREALLKRVQDLRAAFVDYYNRINSEHKNPSGFPRSWDLRKEIVGALNQLESSLIALDTVGVGVTGAWH